MDIDLYSHSSCQPRGSVPVMPVSAPAGIAEKKTGDILVFSNKCIDPLNREEWASLIRYAEVVLNASEAYFKNSDATSAFSLLNK